MSGTDLEDLTDGVLDIIRVGETLDALRPALEDGKKVDGALILMRDALSLTASNMQCILERLKDERRAEAGEAPA